MNLKEEDLVLCTVKKIEGTTIFVDIENNGPASIVMSEIAAGRIRNLRQYVTPNKKIVCKVLNTKKGQIELSLRRVTAKERQEVLDNYKKERNLISMLKTIIKNPEKTIEKIKQIYTISEFLDEAKENPQTLNKFFTKTESEKLSKTIAEKQEKAKIVKRTITLTTTSPTGLLDIQQILKITDINTKINYLGSSKFEIRTQAQTFKQAEQTIQQTIQQIEKVAKQKQATFQVKDKK
jgi:translation initiation factor 2 subunit 1